LLYQLSYRTIILGGKNRVIQLKYKFIFYFF
jgi:hypothetical protein